jgi:outer membrane protein OmpA-like peptidoglycan-associated protein
MRIVLITFLVFLATGNLLAQQDVQLTPACFNTSYDDFGTRKIGDKLYVLSASKDPCEDIMEDPFTKKPYSDLYEVEGCKTKDAKLLSEESKGLLNVNSCYYDGPVSANAAGNLLFFTNNFGSNQYEKLTIHYSTKNDKGEWSKPMPVPFNDDKYNVTHPFFDEKNNTLYFVSDMPGGLGGMDIYRASFDGKKFGEKELVRNVNSAGHDCFPYVMNNKLYFSSNAFNTLGGYDLFVLDNLEVKNLGGKYNSKFDDLAIMFLDEKTGYITSNRSTNGATDDIFEFRLIDLFVDVNLSYVVKDNETLMDLADVKMKIIEDSTGIILFQGTTDQYGHFLQKLDSLSIGKPMKLTVSLEKEGYISKDVSFTFTPTDSNEINVGNLVDLNLTPLKKDLVINELLGLKTIYYDFDKADLRSDAIVELDKVVAFMNKHETVELELGSHTDCRGPSIYNLDLSNRRALSAANYIKARISKPERIAYKGFGESNLKVNCPCEGLIKSNCSASDNQLNRRTEFMVKNPTVSTGDHK